MGRTELLEIWRPNTKKGKHCLPVYIFLSTMCCSTGNTDGPLSAAKVEVASCWCSSTKVLREVDD